MGNKVEVIWDLGGGRQLGTIGATVLDIRRENADHAVCRAARTLATRGTTVFQAGPSPGVIVVCDAASGATHELIGPTKPIEDAAASPTGRFLFTRGEGGQYAIWDVHGGRGTVLEDPVAPCALCELAITDDGTPRLGLRSYKPSHAHCAGFGNTENADYVAAGDLAGRLVDGTLQICDLASDAITTLPADRDTELVDLDAVSKLAFGSTPTGLAIWDLRTSQRTAIALGERIARVWQVTDDTIVLSSHAHAFVIDRKAQREVARVAIGERPRTIAISPQRDRIAIAGGAGHAQLFDLVSGAHRSLRGEGAARDVAFVDGGRAVVTVGERGVWRWKDTMPGDPTALRAWVRTPQP